MCGTSEEALDHPQIIANGEVVEIDDPVLGTVREVGPVATFAREPVGDHPVGARARRRHRCAYSCGPLAAVHNDAARPSTRWRA